MFLEVCNDFFNVNDKEYARLTILNNEGNVEMRMTLPISKEVNKTEFTLQIQKLNELLKRTYNVN